MAEDFMDRGREREGGIEGGIIFRPGPPLRFVPSEALTSPGRKAPVSLYLRHHKSKKKTVSAPRRSVE